jgi:alpha 1,3-glucosidase
MTALNGLSGFAFTGEDVGGHKVDTNEQLLVRWYQLGAWVYPFYREHSSRLTKYREPWLWPEASYKRMVKAIKDRYRMIAFWYTICMESVWTSKPPIVPLWYEWPEIEFLHTFEKQILLGDSLLVSPVLEENVSIWHVYCPPGIWYEFWSGKIFKTGDIPVTMDDCPVHIRGGKIVPMHPNPVNNTYDTIRTDMELIIALDEEKKAAGSLYLDDGVTMNYSLGVYVHRTIRYSSGRLEWKKADEEEKRVPEFLEGAMVKSISIYSRDGVQHVGGLKYKVGDEWTWQNPRLGSGRKEGAVSVACGLVLGLGLVCVGVVLVWKRRSRVGIDCDPLITIK